MGDLTSGLFLAGLLHGKTPAEALEHTASAYFAVMQARLLTTHLPTYPPTHLPAYPPYLLTRLVTFACSLTATCQLTHVATLT